MRASERALLVSEQLAFQELFGNCGAVDDHQRTVAAQAPLPDRACDDLLAGAALALHEDGEFRRRHAADQGAQGERCRRLADDAEVIHILRLHCRPLLEVYEVGSPFERGAQLVERNRLDEVVEGAHLHGLDRDRLFLFAGDDDGLGRGVGVERRPQDLEPLVAVLLPRGEGEVDGEQLGPHLPDGSERFLLALRRVHLEVVCQAPAQLIEDVRMIVDDEEIWFFHSHAT
jgi:hypothetical protein